MNNDLILLLTLQREQQTTGINLKHKDMKKKKQFSGIKARLYSSTFDYFTKYVNLPCWLFEQYKDDKELLDATINYINSVTCNIVHKDEHFELYTK